MAMSMELLLIQFLMPDNDAWRQAKDPQVVPALVDHLHTAKTSTIRQLSAVLLRKKIRPLGQALCQDRPYREHHPRRQLSNGNNWPYISIPFSRFAIYSA
ncbi:hypothetical protein COCNU_scaffold019532G000090 [Cocos nucifera]|nr:hypothetical protein [Cocos nucifera]